MIASYAMVSMHHKIPDREFANVRQQREFVEENRRGDVSWPIQRNRILQLFGGEGRGGRLGDIEWK
jgi:hypothetical protein